MDEAFRPFVRALGNLVITFALAEAKLLELVSEMLGGDELTAVSVLKSQDAKEQVLGLVKSIGLSGFDLDELLTGVGSFWADKDARNRLIHDEWFAVLYERGTVGTRGLTRSKTPQEIFGMPNVDDIWRLAVRFGNYDGMFSHRAYMIRRERSPPPGDVDLKSN